MKSHEKTAVLFLLRHLFLGATGGFVFGAVLLWQDIFQLRTLLMSSDQPWLWLFMLFFGLFITFGSVGMGAGVMAMGRDDY